MLQIKKLKLKGWCQHKDLDIQFGPGTNGIIGENGSGKSNLINALYFLLTGKSASSGTLEEDINDDMDSALVSGILSFDDVTDVSIERKLKAPNVAGCRQKVKTSARMRIKEETITGSKAVTDAIFSMTSFSPKLFSDHIFISQNQLTSLLFNGPSERLKMFIELIPDLSKAEKRREQVHKAVLQCPVIEVGASLDELKDKRKKQQKAYKEYTQTIRDLEQKIKNSDIQAVSSSISNFIEYKDIASKIDDRQTRLEKENNNVISLTVSLADSDSVIAELKNEAESVREKAKDAEKRLKELNEQSRLFAEKQRMRASLFKSVERLNKVTEPEKNPEFDKISDYLSGLAQLTSELEAKVKLKKILQEGGVCPTCGSEFKDSETTLDDVIAEIEALNKSIKTMQARLSSLKAGKDKYDRNRHKYIEEKASIESEIKITSNKLKEYENVAEVDEDERVKLEAAIEDYKDITGRAAELEQNNKAINQNLEKAKSTVSALEKEIEDLREKSKISIVSQKEYEALVKILEEYNKIKSELTELKVRADSSKKVIDDYSASIEKYEKDIERSKNIIEFKNTLETVKTILHRDKLPKRSLMSYISELDSEINAFLKYFSNPFCLTITEDMDLICTMPSGHIRPAHRLSGGQRAVLSVCTRFALCEIFSKNIGLLVLDEPSQNLDQERVKFLAEFMKHVNAASKNAAAQTIVITHHVDEMGSVFDNNIVLSN